MTTLLQLNTSIFSDAGASSRLSAHLVERWLEARPGTRVLRRDLGREPVPHLDATTFTAFGTAPEGRTDEQRAAVERSDSLIAELRETDVLVLGLPMYNFSVPSALKAYFDHVARAGVTFRYGSDGPEGLLGGKKAIVLATRGGSYAGTDADGETAYVRGFLGFLGIEDVTFVYAENLAGDRSLLEAERTIDRLLADSLPTSKSAAAA